MPPPPAARLHGDAGAARHAAHHHVHWPPASPTKNDPGTSAPHDDNDPTTPRRPHPLTVHVLDALHAAGGSFSPPSAHPRPSPTPAAPLPPYPMAPSRAYAWYARPDLPDPRARLPKPPNTVANRLWTALLGSDPPRSKVLAPSASTLHVHDEVEDPTPVEPITLFEWIEKVAHNLNPLAPSSSSTDSLNQLLRVASDEGMRAMFLQQLDPPVVWRDPSPAHDPAAKPGSGHHAVPSSVTHLAHWLDPAEWLDTDDAPPAFLRVLTAGTATISNPTRTRDALLSTAWVRSLRLDQTIVQTARLHAAQRAMRHDLAAWPTELARELNDLHELVEMVQEEAELVFADSSLPLSRESYGGGDVVSASAADAFLAGLPVQLWGVAAAGGAVAAGAAAAAGVGASNTAHAVGADAMPGAAPVTVAGAAVTTVTSTGPAAADTPTAVPPNPTPSPDPTFAIPSTDLAPSTMSPAETTAAATAPAPIAEPLADVQLDALPRTTRDRDVNWVVVSSTTSLLQHYSTESESVLPPATGQDASANDASANDASANDASAAPVHVLSVIPERPSSTADTDDETTPVPGIRIQIGGIDAADADSPETDDSPVMVTAPGSPAVPSPAPLAEIARDAGTAAWLADQALHITAADEAPDFVSRTDIALPGSHDGDEMVVEDETSTLSSLAASVRASMSAFSLHGARVVPPEWAASDTQIGTPHADVGGSEVDLGVSTATINSAPRAPAPAAPPAPASSAMLLPRPKLPSIARSAHSLRVPGTTRLPPAAAAASAARIKSELSLGAAPTAAALRAPMPVAHRRARSPAAAGSSTAMAAPANGGDDSVENVRVAGREEEEAYYSEASSVDASTASFATTDSDASRGTWRAPARGAGVGVGGSSVVYEEDEEDEEDDDFFDDDDEEGDGGFEGGDGGYEPGKDRSVSTVEPTAGREGGERRDEKRGAGTGL
ncbi:hypothetical protein GGF32_010094 [Allomyces javanicus]|nr:hypothetical protein GGF32_010094 [Allomyces javanicus]